VKFVADPLDRVVTDIEEIMDLHFTPEDMAFRERTRQWFEANTPRAGLKTVDDRKAWQRQLYEAGFVGMGWPVEYGGFSARPMQQAIVADEMARAGAPMPANPLGLSIVGPTLLACGDEWQKQRYVKKILTAEEIWCQLFSEPNAGSDLASLQTRAEDAGDHFPARAHRFQSAQASGHLLLSSPHAPAGRGGAAAQANHRRLRVLGGLFHRRAG
jgi:alkylation response protein AidB-like acyl-CoA dehydrogenase